MEVTTASDDARAPPRDADRAAARRPARPPRIPRRRRPATTSCSCWRAATASEGRGAAAAGRGPRHRRLQPGHRASTTTPASCATAASGPATTSRATTSSAAAARATRPASRLTSTTRWASPSCVTCGECVAACPTGALDQQAAARRPDPAARRARRQVDTVCPYCGVGCALTYHVDDEREAIAFAEGRDQPGNKGRLCVKGRYGWDYAALAAAPDHAADPPRGHLPQGRRSRATSRAKAAARAQARRPRRLRRGHAPLPRGELGGGARPHRRRGRRSTTHGPGAIAGFGSAKCSNEEAYLFQKLIRAGLRHQQRRPLHPAVPRLERRRAVRGRRLRRRSPPPTATSSTPTSRSSPAPTPPPTTRSPPRSSSRPAGAAPS